MTASTKARKAALADRKGREFLRGKEFIVVTMHRLEQMTHSATTQRLPSGSISTVMRLSP